MSDKNTSKVVVITGGATGIGKALAILYLRVGDHVVVISRNSTVHEEVREELSSHVISDHQELMMITADVTKEDSIKDSLHEVIKKFNRVDILILSAGIGTPGYFEQQENQLFRDIMEVNFYGVLYSIQAVFPQMKKQGNGKICIISSGAALMGIFGNTAYSSSKFAVRGLGEVLRWEGKPHGIQVTMAYPPVTETPMYHRNKNIKPWENKLIVGKEKFYAPDRVAKSIFKGIKKGRYAAVTGLTLYLLLHFGSFITPLVYWYYDRKIRRERKQRAAVEQ